MSPTIRSQSGFSLLELMVVLMIIGILITYGVISLNLGDRQAKVEEEVQRIRGVLELAQEEAVLKHRELALRFERDAYTFASLEEGKWVDFDKDREFKTYTLPEDMHFYVEVKDGSLPLADSKGATQAMIYILSSGEVTPFDLTVEASDGSRYSLATDFLGRSRAYNPGQGPGS
jgi:general secretion pathway protein H